MTGRIGNKLRVAGLLSILALAAPTVPVSVSACSATSAETNPEILVRNTEIIVRATAIRYGDQTPPDQPARSADQRMRFIEFRVEEILRGELAQSTLLIKGFLTETSDYNDRPVPYDFVRPMGRGGSCHAYYYEKGAEFLLFLKRQDAGNKENLKWGEITPYWASMAPTNEELYSSNDAWVGWVKARLATEIPCPTESYADICQTLGIDIHWLRQKRDGIFHVQSFANIERLACGHTNQ